MKHPLLVITEPAANDRDREPVRVALDVLRGSAEVKVTRPQQPGDLQSAVNKRGRRRPVVIGGDQLLHAVVEVLHRRRELAGSLLGWVPLGSRHDLATTVGIPADPAGAARVVLTGAERWLDLLVDDAGGVAINSVRVGGPTPSPIAGGFAGAARRSTMRLRVEADGAVLADRNRRVVLVGLGNGADVGGGALAAEAVPDDGLAEVVVSAATGPLAWLGHPARQRGEHVRRDGVRIVRARAVTVSGQDFPYATDGVTCGPVRLRTWTVQHSAWRLTVPALER